MTMHEIEAAIERNLRDWGDITDYDRCSQRRMELLEMAAAAPLATADDAAAAIRVFLKSVAAEGWQYWDDAAVEMAHLGPPEDLPLANILRSVQRFLAERGA
jgi:hypothetical protein